MKDPLETFRPPATLSAIDSITWSAPRHDLSWFREQLTRYTYKPGWRFYVDDGAIFGFTVYLVGIMSVEDTYNPGHIVEVSGSYPLYSADHNEDVFGRCVEALITKMELHEAQEWLRRDGQIYNDPHKQRS